jgi:outer membrane receptor for ferrienterochelin and colicins
MNFNKPSPAKAIFFVLLLVLLAVQARAQRDSVGLLTFSVVEFLNMKITTATKNPEKITDAPATVIVITREDIRQRGYAELSEIFSDLPGMDITRTYGDTYMKNYWRGVRNTINSPYLVLIDGVEFSQLYYNASEMITTFSLSNIERIEIVYGPASSVYGPNAFMGVVNIITVNDKAAPGSYMNAKLTGSLNNYFYGDFNYFYKKDDFRISLSGHLENGDINRRVNGGDFYYLKDKLYADRKLWGGFVDNPNLGGEFSSPVRHHSLDFRMYMGKVEVALQYHNMYSGFGTVYPADKIQSRSLWILPHVSFYTRFTHEFSKTVSSQTMFRYKIDGVNGSSPTIESFDMTNTDASPQFMGGTWVDPNETVRFANYSLWQTRNSAFYVFQDFNFTLGEKLSVATGLKYDYKNLQKAYDFTYGETFAADSLDVTNDAVFPRPPSTTNQYNNRIIWQDKSAYFQAKYQVMPAAIFNVGLRLDDNSAYGSFITLRSGIVYHVGKFTSKFLYGEAFQEPSPRTLYGGWTGSGSDPNIKPTKSKTVEGSLGYTTNVLTSLVSVYYVQNSNTIVTFTGGAKNLGKQELIGSDFHLQTNLRVSGLKQLKLWSYYSVILKQEEHKFDPNGNRIKSGIIGDLATHKIYFGTTGVFSDKLDATLSGRLIGKKETVSTNPIRSIDSYLTVDLNVNYRDFFVKGLGASIRVTNLFDKKYFNTGIREANSGETQGSWSGRTWTGSQGYYNSKLPQPGRFILLSITFDI